MLGLPIVIAFQLLSPEAYAETPPCTNQSQVKTVCDIKDLGLLRPTQLTVGYRAVKEKSKKLKDMSDDDYRDYLRKNAIPVIIGPNGYYPLDHHHLARAIYENGKTRVVLQIKANWSADTITVFLNKMAAVNCQSKVAGVPQDKSKPCFYLYGALGQSITVSDIPKNIWLLRDDPYRSLAGEVRDQDGFTKKETDFYIEFAWALFFRKLIPNADLTNDEGFKRAVKDALKIAHSSSASHMPGYKP